jgi:nitrite reductase (NADH) large subunit
MKTVVIGNGLAGTLAAKTLRELDSQVEIEVFAEEKYPYYPRPNLIEYIAGNLSYERLFAFTDDWHIRQKINIHLGEPVLRILPESGEVEVAGGRREKYDRLLVANGASSFIPPIKGAEKRGVFSLRTLADAEAIIDYLRSHPNVLVIGGGLLGLETARAVRSRGAEVEVVEFFDRLLPRQLDTAGAAVLKKQIENMGIRVHLGVTTEEILGGKEVNGVKLKDGPKIGGGMVIVAAGIRPNLMLAKEAGIAVDRGIIVDDLHQTNQPNIFAAGDSIQHRGKIYGIIPAAFEQARASAHNIISQQKKYEGTTPSNTLKVAGLHVTSVGLVNPEGEDYKEHSKTFHEEGIYKKVVVQDGALVGAIWMGTRKGTNEIVKAVTTRRKVEAGVESLLEDDFDFSRL